MKPAICIVDLGLFTSLAETFAQAGYQTFYWSPGEETPYHRRGQVTIGTGIPGVTRVLSLSDPRLKDVDLYAFPDIGQGYTQLELSQQGKRVWGSRRGEQVEVERIFAKKLFARLGFNVGGYEVVKGTDALREYVWNRKDLFVKVDKYRGDMETWKWKNRAESTEKLLDTIHTFGPAFRTNQTFVVEDKIDGIEVAIDTYCVDGKFPRMAFCGIEMKGTSYLAHALRWPSIPTQLREVYERLSPALKQYRYRNILAVETLITSDGKAFPEDPCCRFGSPQNEALQIGYANFTDIVVGGAEGVLVEPKIPHKWIAEVALSSTRAEDKQVAVQYPASISKYVKLRQYGIVGGTRYYFPGDVPSQTIGAVVGVGDTAQEAINMCKKHVDMVSAEGIDSDVRSLDDALDKVRALKQYGAAIA
jgi:Phosphoribosylglycinamide synthetase, ATP-grasp (A) domain